MRAPIQTQDLVASSDRRTNGPQREAISLRHAMPLHTLYLASISHDGAAMDTSCQLALTASFGRVEHWRDGFVALGNTLDGGSGWMLLLFDPHQGMLVNQAVIDLSQVLPGGVPLLALDLHEPAGPPQGRIPQCAARSGSSAPTHHQDFGAAAPGDQVDTCLGLIDWPAVYQRYQQAVHTASAPFGVAPDEAAPALLLDVRRAAVFANATSMLPGARWQDPATVSDWATDLPVDREVVVYCVHGHEVSRATALRLRAAGVNARYLQGGIDAWRAAGRPLAAKGAVP